MSDDAVPPNLGEVMGQLARALQEEHGDVSKTLEAITAAAVRSVPGTDRKQVATAGPHSAAREA